MKNYDIKLESISSEDMSYISSEIYHLTKASIPIFWGISNILLSNDGSIY